MFIAEGPKTWLDSLFAQHALCKIGRPKLLVDLSGPGIYFFFAGGPIVVKSSCLGPVKNNTRSQRSFI